MTQNDTSSAVGVDMNKLCRIVVTLSLALGFCSSISGIADAHFGLVDGYGCHLGSDKVSYHCHQGEFAGRTFKSKADFLRELRGGKSDALSPKKNQPLPEKKPEKIGSD